MDHPIVLKDFGGVPEVTQSAFELRTSALAAAKPVKQVTTDEEQTVAVAALRELKDIRTGMESTRKAIKAPVIALGKKIDSIASDFLQECDREEMRLTGMINHFQKKQFEEKRAEQERVAREAAEVVRLEAEAKRLREEAEAKAQAAKTRVQREAAQKLQAEAAKLEEKVFAQSMESELAPGIVAVVKPKGLTVRNRVNFKLTDPHVFIQAYPDFWKPCGDVGKENEVLRLDRMRVLDELNKEDGKGIFHRTHFPEELAPPNQPELAKVPGMNVFFEVSAHVR